MNTYQAKSYATRSRRTYSRPTKAQRQALAKALGRNGRLQLTVTECTLLATHPDLTFGQRCEFAQLGDAKAAFAK